MCHDTIALSMSLMIVTLHMNVYRWCDAQTEKFGIQPFKGWGRATQMQQAEWKKSSCDQLLMIRPFNNDPDAIVNLSMALSLSSSFSSLPSPYYCCCFCFDNSENPME
jgi:hypothetical protein